MNVDDFREAMASTGGEFAIGGAGSMQSENEYQRLKEAVEPIGGTVCGFAAIVMPEGPIDQAEGYAVAVLLNTDQPIGFVVQRGSAPRRDLENLRRAMRELLDQPKPARRSMLAYLRARVRDILK